MGIFVLENPVQDYAWGSPTAIPALIGAPNPAREPRAELWIGAHGKAPSLVVDGDRRTPLDERIAADPIRWLGKRVVDAFDGTLPFLLKVLAAAEPLSIQCHPSRAQAARGFDREEASGMPVRDPNRNYRDRNHKPELICALSTFTALKGFKDETAIAADLRALAIPALESAVEAFVATGDLAALYRNVMTRSTTQREAIALDAARRASSLEGPSFEWIARLAHWHPGDIGVLTPAFLNVVELSQDEAIYLGAGELHAYLGGVGVELMASSDNVIRGGLTKKHVDVPELLETLDFVTGPAEILRPRRERPGTRVFDSAAPDFVLSVVDVANDTPHETSDRDAIELVLVADGDAMIFPTGGDDGPLQVTKGRAVVIAADVSGYRIEGSARIYKAGVPR